MRLPRVRFTVQRMMIAVLIMGAIIGWYVEGGRRRLRFYQLSNWHSEKLLSISEGPGWLAPSDEDTAAIVSRKASARRLIRYHYQLSKKYQDASRYPWLPVAPDPPEPK